MPILDALHELSDAQTAVATTTQVHSSTNIIDWGTATAWKCKIAPGTPLFLNIRMNTGITGGRVAFSLVINDDEDLTTTPTTLYTTPAITAANLTAGTWVLRMPLPYEVNLQYLGVVYTASVTAITVGKYDAWISLDSPSDI